MSRTIVPQVRNELAINVGTLTVIAQALSSQQPTNDRYHAALQRALDVVRKGRAFDLRSDALRIQSEDHDELFSDTTLADCCVYNKKRPTLIKRAGANTAALECAWTLGGDALTVCHDGTH